ncbi:nucleoside phosphorylase [Microbacterium sp. cf332]|uniref:phosphorylase family protein n=1 Tax=Microbacterium sp. cf332 TaxID=1761804 RepID=UPI00088363E1|nr:nucleoside phosphorylase [Microbacterium sp. cf332]SDQ26704.1 adenosylhomocysteine nucleosidase [Microbacterium sp. cf332]
MRRLLVVAHRDELTGFPDHIPGFDILLTGPGKLPAAHELTRALDRSPYDEVVVVGTAGAVAGAVGPGIYEIADAVQHDVFDLAGVRGRHLSMPERVETGREGVRIATGDVFVDDADAVAVIRSLGAQLVDMETYVYIWVAERFGVPIRVLKAVSDDAQDGATTGWDDAVAACSAALYARIRADYGV